MDDFAPPDGFERHFRQSGLTEPWEPLYSRQTNTGIEIGFLAGPQHCNSRGFVHGGLLTSIADNALGLSCAMAQDPPLSLVTATLQVNFLSSCQQGEWVSVVPEFRKIGKRLSFASGRVMSGDTVRALVTASFSVMR